MSRQHWIDSGDLFPCPNPPHEFDVGRITGQWQWAKDAWSVVDSKGDLLTYAFAANSLRTPDGLKAYTVVLWRLKVLWAVVPQPKEQSNGN